MLLTTIMTMHCNGDDDDDIGNDDCYKIFIADHRFRYSVLGFFATTLLEVKKVYSFVPDTYPCGSVTATLEF